MTAISSVSPISIRRIGRTVPGASDRQQHIAGFDQAKYAARSILFVGAGGLVSFIAPTVVRKGIAGVTVIDHDTVEASNLNRQRFYPRDVGRNKAVALVENLVGECIAETRLAGYALSLTDAIHRGIPRFCDVAVCGVDNNPSRTEAARYFRSIGKPVVFCAVSADADHGYVFVQEATGPCLGCLFPDSVNDDRYPCPGTPAVADILQAVGSLAVYAIDTLLMERPRRWNYRRIHLSDGTADSSTFIRVRSQCPLGVPH